MKNNRIPRPGMVLLLLARPAPAPADDIFVPNIIVTNNVEPPSSGFRQQTRRPALRSRRLGCTPRRLPVHHESAMSLPGLRPHQAALSDRDFNQPEQPDQLASDLHQFCFVLAHQFQHHKRRAKILPSHHKLTGNNMQKLVTLALRFPNPPSPEHRRKLNFSP
jgi:hypothetical protein